MDHRGRVVEYKAQIVIGGAIAIVTIVALAASVPLLLVAPCNNSCPATHEFGGLPYVELTPRNMTYSLPLSVRVTPSLSLSIDGEHSYAVQFSNGTKWVYTGGACNPGYNSSATPGNPCPLVADGYVPEGGNIVNGSVNLARSGTTFSLEPSSVPGDFDGKVTVNVNMRLPAGVYALFLFMDYSTPGGKPTFEALAPEAIVITG